MLGCKDLTESCHVLLGLCKVFIKWAIQGFCGIRTRDFEITSYYSLPLNQRNHQAMYNRTRVDRWRFNFPLVERFISVSSMGAKLNELNFMTVETLATQAFQFHRGFIDWDFFSTILVSQHSHLRPLYGWLLVKCWQLDIVHRYIL